ncbi:hypothetical protein APSETT444_000606 [Aspergillus pseudonomiae]
MDLLPTELLLLTGDYIHDLPTKRALSECSRRFRQIFQPLLYTSITFGPTRSIPLIVQNLCREPYLASRVRHITLAHDCEHWNRLHQSEIGRGIDSTLIHRILNETFETKTEKTRWKKYLNSFCGVAWVGLLLTRLSRLETLLLAYDHDELLQDILEKAAMRQRPFHNTPPFPCLRRVQISSLAAWKPVTTDFVLPFLYFPVVREVLAYNIQERPLDQIQRSLAQLTIGNPVCQVTRAGVMMGASDPTGMAKWAKLCPKLEHFHVVLYYPPNLHDGHLDIEAFRQALRQAKDTLKSLRLGFMWTASKGSDYQTPSMVQCDLYGLLGSLKDFSVLQQLSIPHASLVGLKFNNSGSFTGQLPCSLEVLEITGVVVVGCFTLIASYLAELVRYRVDLVPRLRLLVLKLGPMVRSLLGTAFLRLVCEAAGVELEIQDLDF